MPARTPRVLGALLALALALPGGAHAAGHGATRARAQPAPRAAASARAVHDAAAGWWRGSVVFQGAALAFDLHVFRDAGTLRATMTCPDMMLLEQSLDAVRADGARLRFQTPDDHPVRFDGTVAGDSLRGGATMPAVPGVIAPGGDAPAPRFALGRTAPPAAPPYRMRDVRFTSHDAHLAATVYEPTGGAAPCAGIVILQGSTSNLRREARFQADRFARAGLAVLVFDKRGSGESTGDYGAATYDVLADDAAAAVECLRHQPGVDPDRVGAWGLSQGAFLAPLVAARVPKLAFLVAVSAPGMPIGEISAYQDSVRLAGAGFDAADITRATTIDRRMHDWLRSGANEAELGALLTEAASTTWRHASSIPARLPAGAAREGWYWRGRTLDPLPAWQGVHVPVLALYGAADELVPARASARAVERAVKRGGNKDVTVRVFPAANHVLRTLPLVAGGAWDWPRVAPGYLDLEAEWLRAHTAAGAAGTTR